MVGSNGQTKSQTCVTERRQNLIQEFQGLLDCIETANPPPTMMCYPCPDQPQIMCLPVCPPNAEEDDGGKSKRQRAKEELNAVLEKLPTISSCATEEIRPTSDLRYVKEENSAHIKYMDIDDFAEWKKNKDNPASSCPPMRLCCMPCPGQCSPPIIPLATCPYLNPQQEAPQVVMPQMQCPQRQQMQCPQMQCPQQRYFCVPCPPQPKKDSKANKDSSKLPWDDRELRGGVLFTGCECNKRNGLQQDCPRTLCQGSPPCLVKPEPDCIPSGGTGLKRPPPRVSNYPYVEPNCENPPGREKSYPRPDPCHRAAVDCDKCVPVLMCRPECEPAKGQQTEMRYCCPAPAKRTRSECPTPAKRSRSNYQSCPVGRPSMSQCQNIQVRMCPQFANPKAQQMCLQSISAQNSACPAFQPLYQMQSCPNQGQQAQQAQQAQQGQQPGYVCFSQCP